MKASFFEFGVMICADFFGTAGPWLCATNQDIEHLYKNSAWKLDKKFGGPAKSYDALRLAITENPSIFDEIDLEDPLKSALIDNIRRRLTPQPVKIRSDVEVACYAYEGINAVKDALRAGLAVSEEDLQVKVGIGLALARMLVLTCELNQMTVSPVTP